jgi:hypothetical protein
MLHLVVVELRKRLSRANAETFDNVSENKLIYMDIFQQYTDLIGTSSTRWRCTRPRWFDLPFSML